MYIKGGLVALSLVACSGSLLDIDSGAPDGSIESGTKDAATEVAPPNEAGNDATSTCHPDPGNFDIPGNGCDDDGDGIVDNVAPCDSALLPDGPAEDMARALGICQAATATKWGLVSATYTNGFASQGAPDAMQHGILPAFGTNVVAREGTSLGILSTGWARPFDGCTTPTDPFKPGCVMQSGTAGVAPPGYPKQPGCQPATNVLDVSSLVLQIKVPNNALGFSYDFAFFSGEFPDFVCSTFIDTFVGWLTSTAFSGTGGDLNISFGSSGPITTSSNFFQACAPSPATVGCTGGVAGTNACALGAGILQGTGFDDPETACGQNDSGGGSTGWLTSAAPVAPGETITLQLMIWDTGDANYDSSVLLDDWKWSDAAVTVATKPAP
ncbi:MAG TPA: choice-of-anchor L domain-containing protein [Polyangiaceae bacterium]|jgi:hypothetical protein